MGRFRLLPTVMAAATLLVLLAFLNFVRQNLEQMRTLRDQTSLIEHTLQVQRELDRVLMQVSEADSSARRYLLTPGGEALAEFAQARGDLDASLTRLQGLTRDNADQQRRIERLRAATTARLQSADRILEVRRTHSLDAALELARATDVGRWRAEIRDVAAELETSEATLLEQRRIQANQAYALAVNGRVGSGIVSASLLVGLVALYIVYARTRQRREAALIQSERRTREAMQREQEARAEAERANRLKDEFLAVLSHELRTPLNAVLGWVQIVQAANPPDPTISRALGSIKRNAEAQQRLVEDLLDVSRIVSGKFPLERRPFELRTSVAAAVEAVRPAADAKQIRLQVGLDPEVPVNGDPDRLQQVATNLLSNAVKFTPPGGSIEVTLARRNGRAELHVVDTGEGIPPELQPYIFDRFRQGDGSSTREHGGLGLGLAIVKHIVDAHGGTIAAHSEGKGKGSTFSVALPGL
jgi:signal transduction histidine kinase